MTDTRLRESHHIKESLNDHQSMPACTGLCAMYVKYFQCFMEPWRQFVFAFALRRLIARPSASIGDELSLRIVYRDHDAALHNALSCVVTDAKKLDSVR